MKRGDIEAFVRRDWREAATAKHQYWAERFRQEGWRPVWDAAQALLVHVRRVRPDYPTDADRAHDLDHHLAFRVALDRIADAFARR